MKLQDLVTFDLVTSPPLATSLGPAKRDSIHHTNWPKN